MMQYRRTPAVLVLVLATAGWAVVLRGQSTRGGEIGELSALQIAAAAPAATAADWRNFAEALQAAGRFAESAQAYQKALEREPYNRQMKFDRAIALARTGDADAFFECMRDLSITEAKLAVEILDRAESQRYLSEDRFRVIAQEAASQARD